MKRFFSSSLVLVLLVMMVTTGCQQHSYRRSKMWYNTHQRADKSKRDIFYIVSTNVFDGDPQLANLTDEVRASMTAEMDYVREHMGDEYNFYAPYYHQLTMPCFKDKAALDSLYPLVKAEVMEAFEYYMKHYNHGRPYVIMGFSQGAMLALDLVKDMKDEDLYFMLQAYLMGYRLSEEDLAHPHVHAATDPTTIGTIASFNTLASMDGWWPLVEEGAATCINPITWSCGMDTIIFTYGDESSRLFIDTTYHVLMAPDLTADKYYGDYFIPYVGKGTLHKGDLLFYLDAIRNNINIRQ